MNNTEMKVVSLGYRKYLLIETEEFNIPSMDGGWDETDWGCKMFFSDTETCQIVQIDFSQFKVLYDDMTAPMKKSLWQYYKKLRPWRTYNELRQDLYSTWSNCGHDPYTLIKPIFEFKMFLNKNKFDFSTNPFEDMYEIMPWLHKAENSFIKEKYSHLLNPKFIKS